LKNAINVDLHHNPIELYVEEGLNAKRMPSQPLRVKVVLQEKCYHNWTFVFIKIHRFKYHISIRPVLLSSSVKKHHPRKACSNLEPYFSPIYFHQIVHGKE
jgi:hypothetical protein